MAFDTERNLLELQYVFKELDTAILTYLPPTTTSTCDLSTPNPQSYTHTHYYKRKGQNYDPTHGDDDQQLPITDNNKQVYKPSPLESSYGDILKQLVFEGNASCNNMYYCMIYHKVV